MGGHGLSFENLFQQFTDWMRTFSLQYGYLGVFLISLIGSISLFLPIPYTAIIFTISGIQKFDPLIVGLVSGAGSAVGEFSGYMLGLGGRKIVGKHMRRIELLQKFFDKFGPLAIFLFALTPLPDDLLFIPLGVMRYSLLKAFIPAIIGKICMSLIVAYGGRFTVKIIREFFGEESELLSIPIGMVIAIAILILILIVMFKVDWEKILAKYLQENNSKTNVE
jgi:membrane protein YqaA with SNARE-associated domain